MRGGGGESTIALKGHTTNQLFRAHKKKKKKKDFILQRIETNME